MSRPQWVSCNAEHGSLRSLPLPSQPAAARAWIDREVFFGIRPECITDGGRGLDFPAAKVVAEVEISEPTGAETVVLARVAGERLRARIAPHVRLTPGQTAAFLVDTRTACLFDPATERLIASG